MKKILSITVLLFSSLISFGQLSRALNAFRELEVTDKINVKLVPSTYDKIIIEGELANQLELSQVNDVLRLKMTGSYIMQGDKVNATVYTTSVSNISARKGAYVTTAEIEIKADSIYLSANEGGSIDLKLNANSVKGVAVTGGSIEINGKGDYQDVDVALGGSYLAQYFDADDAIVRVSGGGKVKVTAKKSIDVQTRAGGIVDIYGNPKERKQRKFAGGKINYL